MSRGRLALSMGFIELGAVTFHQSMSVSWSPGVDGGWFPLSFTLLGRSTGGRGETMSQDCQPGH